MITSAATSPASAWLASGSLTDAFQAQNQALMERRSQTTRFEMATPTESDRGESAEAATPTAIAESTGQTKTDDDEAKEEMTTATVKTRSGLSYLRRPAYADRHRKSMFVMVPAQQRRKKHEQSISKSHRRAGQCDVGTQMDCHPRSNTEVRNAEAQTEVTLPRTVEAHWHCHCVGAETVVDVSEMDDRATGIHAIESVFMIHGNANDEGDDNGSNATTSGGMFDFEELDGKMPVYEWSEETASVNVKEMIDKLEGNGADEVEPSIDTVQTTSYGSWSEFESEVKSGDFYKKRFGVKGILKQPRGCESRERPPPPDEPGAGETHEQPSTVTAAWPDPAISGTTRRDIRVQRTTTTTTNDNGAEVLSLPGDHTTSRQTGGTHRQTGQLGTGVVRMRMAKGITIDSGAADNVMPRRLVRGKFNKVRQSPGSRSGLHYLAANNARIANEGETDFQFLTDSGDREKWVFQVAEVNKVLCAVSYLVDNGYKVTFDQDAKSGRDTSHILHKQSGRIIKLNRARNVWSIEAIIEEDRDSDFARQG